MQILNTEITTLSVETTKKSKWKITKKILETSV